MAVGTVVVEIFLICPMTSHEHVLWTVTLSIKAIDHKVTTLVRLVVTGFVPVEIKRF